MDIVKAKSIVDMTAGAGTLATTAFKLGIPYLGFTKKSLEGNEGSSHLLGPSLYAIRHKLIPEPKESDRHE